MRLLCSFKYTFYSGGLRQALVQEKHSSDYKPQKVDTVFADLKYNTGHCFASCYCIVVDDENK